MRTEAKRSRSVQLLVLAGAVLVLSGCGGSDAATAASNKQSTTPAKASVELVASGFGQAGKYLQGIVVVTTDNNQAVGEFVTASVNFLDPAGAILKTQEQVESFSWVNQQLVLPVWLDLSDTPDAVVASIEPSVSISNHGDPRKSRPELPTLDSESIGQETFTGTIASFTFTNNAAEDLTDLRVGVVCYDTAGAIVGGGSAYPDLVAAGKKIRIDAKIITTGLPEHCKGFPSYGY